MKGANESPLKKKKERISPRLMHRNTVSSGGKPEMRGLRSVDDYFGKRIVITKGKYRCKKGLCTDASEIGIFVDLDFNGLRIIVQAQDITVLDE